VKSVICSEIGTNEKESFDFISYILDNTEMSFIFLDGNLAIKYFNKTAEKVKELKNSSIINKYFVTFLKMQDGSIFEEILIGFKNIKEITLETYYDKKTFKNCME
jgi:transcriptional regulator with PAS, ATPase and Fis domain